MKLNQVIIDQLKTDFIKELNKCNEYQVSTLEDLDKIEYQKNNGAVYFINATKNGKSKLRYIGKSKGNSLKSRFKSHFFGIGKGTVSRFQTVSNYRENGCGFFVKIVWTNPQSLRNLLEEIFIDKYRTKENLWNGKKLLTTTYKINCW